MRTLSSRKLDEVQALIERAEAMRGWLEVARECRCATPDECTLFDASGEGAADSDPALRLIEVGGKDCLTRRIDPSHCSR